MQGSGGTCYIMAATSSLAEFPDQILNIFQNYSENTFTLKFYIRGKPWLVKVDDMIVFQNSDEPRPYFSRISYDGSFWSVIVEKAWSKIKGTYTSSDGGYLQSGLRSLIGAPVFGYRLNTKYDPWQELKEAEDKGYLLTASTTDVRFTGDTNKNNCSLQVNHAYTILHVFERNGDKFYMMRNPWGRSSYNRHITSIENVPFNLDLNTSQEERGIFVLSSSDIFDCFSEYQIGHIKEGYSEVWYD